MMLISTKKAPWLVALLTACAGIASANCGEESDTPPKQTIQKIVVDAAATGLDTPLDAAPDPMGQEIYFIATSAGQKGVFHVPAAGGDVNDVSVGAPLIDPQGLVTSADGQTVYVADRAAPDGGGAIFTVSAAGGAPALLAGSMGTHPTALDLVVEKDGAQLYFTGTDPSGAPAVLKMPAAGGTASVVVSDPLLVEPDGVAVAANGDVYIGDRKGGPGGLGQAFVQSGGAFAAIGSAFKPGAPLGTALTLDESKLLLSSLNAEVGSSQVAIVALADGQTSTFDDVIKQNDVSGGLHRALFKDVYAWAGRTGVFRVRIVTVESDSSSIGGPGD